MPQSGDEMRRKIEGKAGRMAFLGVFLALAMLAGYVERLAPPPVPAIPGIKLGFANAAPLFLMHRVGNRPAFGVNVARCVLTGLLFTGLWGMAYALAGALASFACMAALRRARIFGLVGVSAAGGVCHNAGQLTVAALAVGNARLFYYTPVLIISGLAAGILVGWIAGTLLRRLG
jgi:heptaprenyl diphosphate synthase